MDWLRSLKINKLFKLTWTEFQLLIRAWFSFLFFEALIRFVPYSRWRSLIEFDKNTAAAHHIQVSKVLQLVKVIEISGRYHFVKVNCLRRCLVQKSLLKSRGISTAIHFGVKLEGERLKAHCWLTHANVVINDSPDVSSEYSKLEFNKQHNANVLESLIS